MTELSTTDVGVLATAARHSLEEDRSHDTAFMPGRGWLCVHCDADYDERVEAEWAAGRDVVLLTVDQVVP